MNLPPSPEQPSVATKMSGPIDQLSKPLVPDVGVIAMVPDSWNSWWQPRHHVLSKLAQYFQIVWVTPASDWREALRSRRNSDTADGSRPPGLLVYEPEFWLPKVYHPKWIERLTFDARVKRARRLLSGRGCRKIILYLWRPEFAPALSSIPFDLSCYHIDDEYSFSEVEGPIDPVEMSLISKVGLVLIHSPRLLERKGAINPNTAFIPNGVDFEVYAKAVPEPSDLAAIPHPRIGYSGLIKKQLDWPLILGLIKRHLKWSFVFVGPPSSHPEIVPIIKELSAYPNVYFVGGKSVPHLAAYPQHFDVCIMPYRVDGYTNQIYPLKLHEYLASGRPIVSAPIRSLRDFSKVIALADGVDEWSNALAYALEPAAACPTAATARREIAREYDWGRLVRKIADRFCDGLGTDHTKRPGEEVVPTNFVNLAGAAWTSQCRLRWERSGTPEPVSGKLAWMKAKIRNFLSDPHFPLFLLKRIERVSPILARVLKYGRYNPNTESYWNKRYESGDYQSLESSRYEDLRREVARLVPPSTKVLDVGCGTGTLMEILREAGCSCVGVDISSVAVDTVRQKGFLAFKCKLPKLPLDLGGNGFDVCTIVETLEHISDPHKTLRNVSESLKKQSGSIIVCVPDDCMKPDEFDEHVFSFNAQMLMKIMSNYYDIERCFSVESSGFRYLIVKGKSL
jgi:glycosyltransferase involved in cell wall biosynthesis/SAM-dependent methyltransferase